MTTVRTGLRVIIAVLAIGLHGCEAESDQGVRDLEGNAVDPMTVGGESITVTLFVDSDCPVSNRYAPEMQRLYSRYAPQGVKFWLVYPDPDITAETIREHLASYAYAMPALRDPEHALVRRARAMVTPEAGIFGPDGTLVYHGRIDDRYVDITRRRAAPKRHDVAGVLDALIAGRTIDSSWNPAPGRPLGAMAQPGVGCFIEDFK